MQRKDRQISDLKNQQQTSDTNIQKLTMENCELERSVELQQLNAIENGRKVANLSRDKLLLIAQVKQLISTQTTATTRSSTESSDNESENEFEVECIRDYKLFRGQRQFLVRWKGFASKYDSWVKEKDLNCPRLFDSYLKNNKLN